MWYSASYVVTGFAVGRGIHEQTNQRSCIWLIFLGFRVYINTEWRRLIGFVMILVLFRQFDQQLKAHLEKMTYIITNPMILGHPVIICKYRFSTSKPTKDLAYAWCFFISPLRYFSRQRLFCKHWLKIGYIKWVLRYAKWI